MIVLDSNALIIDSNFESFSSTNQPKPLIIVSLDSIRQLSNQRGCEKEKVRDKLREAFVSLKVAESETQKRGISFNFNCAHEMICYDKKRKGIIKEINEGYGLLQTTFKLLNI